MTMRVVGFAALLLSVVTIVGCDIAPSQPVLSGKHAAATPAADVQSPRPAARRPNILLIVADDLGYLDLGAFGGEIRTPNLDRLANAGVRFTNFRAAPTCALTRAMLMTGSDNHLVGLGAQFPRGPQVGAPGYEGFLSARAVTLPEILRASGYATYMAGKWHLGKDEAQSPAARGFDSSFALLLGAGSHFDLTGPGPGEAVKALYRDNGVLVEKLPADFYSSNAYTDKMIGYIRDGQAKGRPFFGYLAYTAPHWPLHAPADYVDRYKGAYDAGYDVVREARIARAMQAKSLPSGMNLADYQSETPTWQSLSAAQRAWDARQMEVYAAMIENMDMNVGRLLSALEQLGELDNTFVFFMSDNGAEGGRYEQLPAAKDWIAATADNRLENLGRPGSFAAYGPGWASASMGPFRSSKGSLFDGGIRVAAFASHPSLAVRGAWNDSFLTVQDVAPSLVELAEATQARLPGTDAAGMRGSSFMAELRGQAERTHAENASFGWEANGSRALIQGKWKIVRERPRGKAPAQWELFDLQADPLERNNLADGLASRRDAMAATYEQYARTSQVVTIEPTDHGRGPGAR